MARWSLQGHTSPMSSASTPAPAPIFKWVMDRVFRSGLRPLDQREFRQRPHTRIRPATLSGARRGRSAGTRQSYDRAGPLGPFPPRVLAAMYDADLRVRRPTQSAEQGLPGRAREASTGTEGRARSACAGSRVDPVGEEAAAALPHSRRRATRSPTLCAVVVVGQGVWGATVSLQA